MTLQNIVDILKALANSQPNIRTTTEGSVYDKLNTNNHIEYDVFHISQTTHREDEDRDYYGFNLFYISRLEDSLEDNRLQIQSIGKEVLSNIIRNLCAEWSIDFPDITYIPFTQRFADLCAGVYCTIQLDVPKDIWCEDDYISSVIPGKDIKLQDLGVTITQNGLRVFTPAAEYQGIGEIRIDVQVPQSAGVFEDKEVTYTDNGVYTVYPDNGYDAMTSVQVEVDVPDLYDEGYAAGEAAGEENQKAKLVSTSFTENNTYTREDGYSAVTVNVPSRYDEGKADGIAEQKAKLSALTVTINGDYTREDGYSAITVNVPQSGQTINNQSKSYQFNSGNTQIVQSGNTYILTGETTLGPDSGYTGLDRVTASCLADITALYDSGYTAGTEAGFVSGTTYQKSLLTSTSFTENNTYTLENGWSSVTINVPQTGGTDRDLIANLQGDYYVIPSGTTHLRDYAFFECTGLTSIAIPDSVTAIGRNAFSHTSLTGVTIPSGVTIINDETFTSCRELTNVNLPSGITDIGRAAFASCSTLKEFTIPSGVTSNTNNTFYACNHLTSVTFEGNGISVLGMATFMGCSALTGITLPDSITEIGVGCFSGCSALTHIVIPSGVTVIGNQCFNDCTSLLDIVIPSSVTRIDNSTFAGCSGLTAMTFTSIVPPTLQSISGWNASLGSTDYTFPIYVPCESLEAYKTAFGAAYAPRIQCNENNYGIAIYDVSSTTSPTEILGPNGYLAFDYLLYGGEKFNIAEGQTGFTFSGIGRQAVYYHFIDPSVLPNRTFWREISVYNNPLKLVAFTIPNTVSTIGSGAFRDTSLETFVLPNSVTGIGDQAFYYCTELTSFVFESGSTIQNFSPSLYNTKITILNIPDSVKYVDSIVHNHYLSSVTIGTGITRLEVGTFGYCSALTAVTIYAATPPTLGQGAFDNTNLQHIYVPAESVNAYKSAAGWSDYSSIISAII